MSHPQYTVTKLLPLVLLSTCFSMASVYGFRLIVLNPVYPDMHSLSSELLPPLSGAVLLIILFYLFAKHLKSGLPHVVLEFHIGLGRLPFLNLLFQFLSASVALVTGFAIGAIGPAVHIGAASSNLVGQFFMVRSHTLRVLTACGAAVGITVMLDTPFMAILFTYETIIRQFRWRTLLLVTAATLFAQWSAHQLGIYAFIITVVPFSLSLLLLAKMLLFGALCGLLSSSFLNCIDLLTRKIRGSYWQKLLLAGLITAIFSWFSPETIGLGYGLLKDLFYEPQTLTLITLWLIIRFISSAAVIALAVPGGALGPSLILGALCGALFCKLFAVNDSQLFIIVGMGALLGAVLHVPLAGILFVLESTNDLNLLLPCLAAGYSAYFIHQHFSKQNSLIELLLVRQNVILRSGSLKKKRLTSPL
ncbi:chloride channel protein [Psychromonas aquimarina]|uniref:chloride channel protein n=1 Tax=Psychromonas aquimarina TaxID=444919 RepID=UPI000A06258E|nr:chloride channel protein [Psychromonas aquimarina]